MIRLLHGDCIEVMRTLAEASVDSIVTDPPYGIGFMGKAWDHADIVARLEKRRSFDSHAPDAGPNGGHKSAAAGLYDLSPRAMRAFQDFSREWAIEALRVLKPGGHLLCFASTRTYHRMACGVEEAGFEIRDQLGWLFGSGFPKSRNLSGEWQGWGTALKPAWEPIVLARKPLVGTVAANVLGHGTGALNIDGCRVAYAGTEDAAAAAAAAAAEIRGRQTSRNTEGWGMRAQELDRDAYLQGAAGLGRWPANIVHDGSEEVQAAFPEAPGQIANASSSSRRKNQAVFGAMKRGNEAAAQIARGDSGSAARFFYCAKADRADRNEGLEGLEGRETDDGRKVPADNAYQRGKTLRQNHHPTVKPTDLMRWLVRLVTPPGGTVLDPFLGSGSTLKAAELEGFSGIGIELSPEYVEIARRRIASDAPLLSNVEVAA